FAFEAELVTEGIAACSVLVGSLEASRASHPCTRRASSPKASLYPDGTRRGARSPASSMVLPPATTGAMVVPRPQRLDATSLPRAGTIQRQAAPRWAMRRCDAGRRTRRHPAASARRDHRRTIHGCRLQNGAPILDGLMSGSGRER